MLSCKNIQLEDNINWEDLITKSNTVTFFQTKEWLGLWSKQFGGKSMILGIYDESNLIGIAPLDVNKRSETVNFLGITPVLEGELVSDFGDVIAKKGKEKEVWKMIISVILGTSKARIPESIRTDSGQSQNDGNTERSKLELNFIREDSPSLESLQQLGGKVEEVDVAPFIDLPKTWEDYLLSLDRHNRHELRRKIRKLEQEKAFKVCYALPAGRQEGKPDIDEFFRLMILASEQKRNFLSEEMKQFFKDIFTTFYPSKKLQLCFLKLAGKNIAAILLFIFKNEYLLYNSGFDPEYANFSPGLLLKAYTIKHGIEEGITKFDFLRGGERYKYDLGGKERKLYKFSFPVIR